MEQTLGIALSDFAAALRRLHEALQPFPEVAEAVFTGTEDWENLLTYKLVPHLAGGGCLMVAVTGGTNTGKSTVFNILVGHALSPVLPTAAATRHPLIAAGALRARQCLDAKLVPEFRPRPLDDAQSLVTDGAPQDALFIAEAAGLPDRLVLLDTPDIDSIETSHWTVAENIRAAGDVLLAVLTAEKYKDDRVVRFFQRALSSGRVVIPVMNKTHEVDASGVAHKQLEEFNADVGLDGPSFVLPYQPGPIEPNMRILSLDGSTDLRSYLESLDVPSIKRRVYQGTVVHFAERADVFLRGAAEVGALLRNVAGEFSARADAFASRYDPAPGAAVGGLFHEFVQSKRGPVRRLIGAGSAGTIRGTRLVVKAMKRVLGGAPDKHAAAAFNKEMVAIHRRVLEAAARDMTASCIESSRNLREPAASLVRNAFGKLDVDAAIARVVAETLRTESVSDEFRRHAYRVLDSWWEDHRGKRRALEALDALLAAVPAAIAAPLSIYSAGVGVAEAVAVAGPFVEQFVARVIEYQFGDAMFDFLSPWKAEQQAAFAAALKRHLIEPALERLLDALKPFEGSIMHDLRGGLQRCRTTS